MWIHTRVRNPHSSSSNLDYYLVKIKQKLGFKLKMCRLRRPKERDSIYSYLVHDNNKPNVITSEVWSGNNVLTLNPNLYDNPPPLWAHTIGVEIVICPQNQKRKC